MRLAPVVFFILVFSAVLVLPVADAADPVDVEADEAVFATYKSGSTYRMILPDNVVKGAAEQVIFVIVADGDVRIFDGVEERTVTVSGILYFTETFERGSSVNYVFKLPSGIVHNLTFSIRSSWDVPEDDSGTGSVDVITVSEHDAAITNVSMFTVIFTIVGFLISYKVVVWRRTTGVTDV